MEQQGISLVIATQREGLKWIPGVGKDLLHAVLGRRPAGSPLRHLLAADFAKPA